MNAEQTQFNRETKIDNFIVPDVMKDRLMSYKAESLGGMSDSAFNTLKETKDMSDDAKLRHICNSYATLSMYFIKHQLTTNGAH